MLIITAVNKSNLAEISDYDWTVSVNATLIAAGSVKGHRRSDGWSQLARMIADAADSQPRSKPGKK